MLHLEADCILCRTHPRLLSVHQREMLWCVSGGAQISWIKRDMLSVLATLLPVFSCLRKSAFSLYLQGLFRYIPYRIVYYCFIASSLNFRDRAGTGTGTGAIRRERRYHAERGNTMWKQRTDPTSWTQKTTEANRERANREREALRRDCSEKKQRADPTPWTQKTMIELVIIAALCPILGLLCGLVGLALDGKRAQGASLILASVVGMYLYIVLVSLGILGILW